MASVILIALSPPVNKYKFHSRLCYDYDIWTQLDNNLINACC